jgi:hypothetical protein
MKKGHGNKHNFVVTAEIKHLLASVPGKNFKLEAFIIVNMLRAINRLRIIMPTTRDAGAFSSRV